MTLPTGLPPLIKRISELTSLEVALKLVEARAGTAVYVPGEVDETCTLARLVGLEPARKLSGEYAGAWLTIPRCFERLLLERNTRICARYEANTPASTLAREHNLTERQVRRIVAEGPATADDKQLMLFRP